MSKSFNNKKVLDNITLEVKEGEIAFLLGSSGVGKSTILRILNDLEKPDSGTIFLDDKPVDTAQLRKEHLVGMVFQHFNLFEHLTVLQNITLALEKVLNKTEKEACEIGHNLLAQYGLTDKAHAYVSQLSGGQKQRLAIVRSLAMKPHIICMDEPTSALDPLLTTHVAHTIQKLAAEGYIVLVASHDTALLDRLECTIYLMKQGHIIESAHTHAFKSNKADYPMLTQFVSGNIE